MHENNMKLSSLDLNLLSVLHALLQTQSVSKAAAMIDRTQPATSHALKRLRLHFGDQILVRDGWKMQLTPVGRSLRGPVDDAIAKVLGVFYNGMPFDPVTSSRRLKIATHDVCLPMFNGLLSELTRIAPGMSVEFCTSTDHRAAVVNHDVDLALGFGKFRSNESLVCTDTRKLSWAVFAPKGHPYSTTKSLRVWSKSKHIAVAGMGGGKGPIEKIVVNKGISRQISMYAPNFLSALLLTRDCDALLTTLKEPFQPLCKELGIEATVPPFKVPQSSATLIHRQPFTNSFEQWLGELAVENLCV